MTTERYIRIIAGTFILLSLALGVEGSPVFVSSWALAFTAFVGANLLQFDGQSLATNSQSLHDSLGIRLMREFHAMRLFRAGQRVPRRIKHDPALVI